MQYGCVIHDGSSVMYYKIKKRLKDMAYLIEHEYGPEFITSNIHLAFHISDCYHNYGPIYSFWLFSFERLNGYIGKL